MVQQRGKTPPPRDTLSRHISERASVQLPSLLTDYFRPKDREELRATRPKLVGELTRHRQIIHRIVRISPLSNLGGYTHGSFPATYLHYWLLTEAQLDSLASFYSQDVQNEWTNQYPKSMRWRADLSLEDKRIQFGRFLGFKGCEGVYPIRVGVEQFKRRVGEMVGGWRFPEVKEKEHVPSDSAAERVRARELEARRRRIERAVGTICMIDAVRAYSMVREAPPSYEEACVEVGEEPKNWRERVRNYKAKH